MKAKIMVAAGTAALSLTAVTAVACPSAPDLFSARFDGFDRDAWSSDVANGSLVVSDGALHVHADGNGRAFLAVNGFSAPGNKFWGRVRVKVDHYPTTPDWAHWTLAELSGAGGEVVRPLGGQYVPTVGKNLMGVGSDGGVTGDWTAWQESAVATAGRWQCLQWRVDGADNSVSVWIDGKAQPEMSVDTAHHGGTSDPFVLPTVTTVRIGWQLYQQNAGHYDAWYDDVGLATHPLGC
jgi:hypothetical protein